MPFLKLLITVSALLTTSGTVCENNNKIENFVMDSDESSISFKHDCIEDFVLDNQTIVFQKTLCDFSGNEYSLYELSPEGYAIYAQNEYSQAFIEGSKTSNSPFYSYLDYDCYYLGFGEYYYFDGCDFKDILYDNTIDAELISSIKTDLPDDLFIVENQNMDIELYSTSFPKNPDPAATDSYLGFTVIKNYDYFRQLKDFPQNTKGTCGITALCMFISYLDLFENDGYIPKNLESTFNMERGHTNTEFGDYIFEKYGHTFAGLSSDKGYPMANGEIENTFKDYLKGECDSDLYKNTEFHDGCLFYTHANPRKYINAGNPAIITMTSFIPENYVYSYDKNKWHTAVAYGYNKDDDTFLIHTGWNSGSTRGAEVIATKATIYSYNTFLYVG